MSTLSSSRHPTGPGSAIATPAGNPALSANESIVDPSSPGPTAAAGAPTAADADATIGTPLDAKALSSAASTVGATEAPRFEVVHTIDRCPFALPTHYVLHRAVPGDAVEAGTEPEPLQVSLPLRRDRMVEPPRSPFVIRRHRGLIAKALPLWLTSGSESMQVGDDFRAGAASRNSVLGSGIKYSLPSALQTPMRTPGRGPSSARAMKSPLRSPGRNSCVSEASTAFTDASGRFHATAYKEAVEDKRRAVPLPERISAAGKELRMILRECSLRRLLPTDAAPNVVPFVEAYHCDRVAGDLYTVVLSAPRYTMPYVMSTLSNFKTSQVTFLIRELASLLAGLHANNIVMTSLHPKNIAMDTSMRTREAVQVISLRNAIIVGEDDADEVCHAGDPAIGLPARPAHDAVTTSQHYQAPETVLCGSELSTAADMWSLGVILAELLSGSAIFASCRTVDDYIEKLSALDGGDADSAALTNAWPNNAAAVHRFVAKSAGKTASHRQGMMQTAGVDPRLLMLLQKLLVIDPKHRATAADVPRILGMTASKGCIAPIDPTQLGARMKPLMTSGAAAHRGGGDTKGDVSARPVGTMAVEQRSLADVKIGSEWALPLSAPDVAAERRLMSVLDPDDA